jgi:hypothetical protein
MLVQVAVKFVVALYESDGMMKIKGFIRGFIINQILSHIDFNITDNRSPVNKKAQYMKGKRL